MHEQKFLCSILSYTLIDFRVQAIENHDDMVYRLSHLFHNVPFQLLEEDRTAAGYAWVLETGGEWLEDKKEKFLQQFPNLAPEENKREYLAFLLQAAFTDLEIHGKSTGNKPLYWLCHLLHDVPVQLLHPDTAAKECKNLEEKFKELKVEKWLENRKREYNEWYNES
ncbi:hypothetical protein [Chitinophaga sp. HK235]|uniref:hypothetical protein n=1 Tax=Chitinophaga sp. HK235 TaxID=2952571 RepID=UPI001BABB2EF|nr:hypothetical protein [Chitinophaga sp. HK235]